MATAVLLYASGCSSPTESGDGSSPAQPDDADAPEAGVVHAWEGGSAPNLGFEASVPGDAASTVDAISSAPPAEAGSGYTIDLTQTSTSGLSSGGFMAVQFQVAFSSIMAGAAVFAGGPFFCAQGSLVTAEIGCMNESQAPSVAPFVAQTAQYAAAGTIDPTSHLASQHIFLFGGADDMTVSPHTMDALQTYYATYTSHLVYESRHGGTAHTMPTLAYGGTCSETASPYIGNCGYDGAGAALAQIYGSLTPAATSLSGQFLTLDQSSFLSDPAAHSLASTGYAYVPASCASGQTCRIHVSFHGCLQSEASVGDAYYKHAGYNEWADTNRIIVLYPQTATGTGSESNPDGCWDWWGYDSPDYANQNGPQMKMVRAMIASFAGK
jgi:poly(3-hydroxybutyrate) depolymerase